MKRGKWRAMARSVSALRAGRGEPPDEPPCGGSCRWRRRPWMWSQKDPTASGIRPLWPGEVSERSEDPLPRRAGGMPRSESPNVERSEIGGERWGWWAQAHPSCLYSVTRYSNLDAKAFCILCPSIAWSGRRLNRSRKAGQDGVKRPWNGK